MKNTFLFLLAIMTLVKPAWSTIEPSQLHCEYRVDPLGVDVGTPRLGWLLKTGQPAPRGIRQSAFQVLVASSPQVLKKNEGDLWDSGQVESDESVSVHYAGKPLKSAEEVFWKVRLWTGQRRPTRWSQNATWTMGLLNPDDWKAHWIGLASADGSGKQTCETLLLRQNFEAGKSLHRATAFVCGLGQYEMTLNGEKVGNAVLAPGWTNYRRTCLYDTYDVTSQIRAGQNTVGLFLGNGMYNVEAGRYTKFTGSFGPLKAIAQLRLEYADGTIRTVGTDENWRASAGPNTFSHVYGGEDFDARLTEKDWDTPAFDAAGWTKVSMLDGPGGELKGLSVANPPIRVQEVLKPIAVKPLRLGVTVYDFGQNAAMMPVLKVSGAAGAKVKVVPSELLKADGEIHDTMTGGNSYWAYTLDGSGMQRYFPKFFYRGARYLQIEVSAPAGGELPIVESLEGAVVQANAPSVGTFTTSNDLFNSIFSLVRWAQRSNLMSVMTDCPHREKLGWLEEDHLNGPALRYNFDMSTMFAKIVNDMSDSQTETGLVPSIAPEYVQFGGSGDSNPFRNSPEWGSALLLVPWQQYQFNGDVELLRAHYANMARYLAYLRGKANGNILDFGLGDWYDIGPKPPGPAQLTPKALTATAIYYEDVLVMAKTAKLIGKVEDAQQYDSLAAQIKAAFNLKFWNEAAGYYADNSQTGNAMPLVLDMVEPQNRARVLEAIIKDIRSRKDGLTAGDVGYRYLLRALADNGRSDVIYEMNNQSDRAGYGYQLKMGATSLTEGWKGENSQNHFMLGQINEWFYHDLAGIQSDGPGFKRFVVKPAFVGDLRSVKATYNSNYGPIESNWSRDNGRVSLTVSIPPNTDATVYLPEASGENVIEGKKPLKSSKGVRFLKQESKYAVLNVSSGEYVFRWTETKLNDN